MKTQKEIIDGTWIIVILILQFVAMLFSGKDIFITYLMVQIALMIVLFIYVRALLRGFQNDKTYVSTSEMKGK